MTLEELKHYWKNQNDGSIQILREYAAIELAAGNDEPMRALKELTEAFSTVVDLSGRLILRLQESEAERFRNDRK